MKKLIILDFDGPLNDLRAAKIKTLHLLGKQNEIQFTDTHVLEILNYIEQLYENEGLLSYVEILPRTFFFMQSRGLLSMTEGAVQNIAKQFSQILWENISIDHSPTTALEKCKLDSMLCIYSSQSVQKIEEVLTRTDISKNLFSGIFGRDSFDEPKPSIKKSPKKICKSFGVHPEEAIMVGDNIAVDLAPAQALGITTILYGRAVDYLAVDADVLGEILSKS